MTTNESEDRDEAKAARVIRKGPKLEEPLRLTEDALETRRRPPSATERYEARVDSHLAELIRDKQSLQEEVHHLREDLRWIEDRGAWQREELARLRTSYALAIGFSWMSFALIAIGGVVVSFATFLHPASQMTIATAALVGLFIGVGVQGYNSWMGTRLDIGKSQPPATETRPHPNPPPSR